ncbi:hypothetical protein C5S35_10380, partial [Candidatus Methanophagaceae archaeon]
IGSCGVMRLKIEGKDAKEMQREIEAGKYDEVIA